ncbi:type II secretion system protein GspJ [Phaeobacter italicus]|uniref:type II secretion system protein GspJ n=1 Tax=Phaeobacter italicus TaxID=481446 RepID=UPI00248E3CA7|nr:type II secretion system protein GspJ [Phaeobacter italicus]
MTAQRHKSAGLTLIEVLVSLAIFAVIGLAGLAILQSVTRTGTQTEGRLDHLAEIDRSFLILKRDLAQGDHLNTQLNNNRLTLQRNLNQNTLIISYQHTGTNLTRSVQNQNATTQTDQNILANVTELEWRLLDHSNQWSPLWPPQNNPQPRPPRAAELTIKIIPNTAQNTQKITRIFPLPEGHSK